MSLIHRNVGTEPSGGTTEEIEKGGIIGGGGEKSAFPKTEETLLNHSNLTFMRGQGAEGSDTRDAGISLRSEMTEKNPVSKTVGKEGARKS